MEKPWKLLASKGYKFPVFITYLKRN